MTTKQGRFLSRQMVRAKTTINNCSTDTAEKIFLKKKRKVFQSTKNSDDLRSYKKGSFLLLQPDNDNRKVSSVESKTKWKIIGSVNASRSSRKKNGHECLSQNPLVGIITRRSAEKIRSVCRTPSSTY